MIFFIAIVFDNFSNVLKILNESIIFIKNLKVKFRVHNKVI